MIFSPKINIPWSNYCISIARGGPNGETDSGSEITISIRHIVFVENCHQREPGHSKILLSNGKTIFVDETQDQIRDMANEPV